MKLGKLNWKTLMAAGAVLTASLGPAAAQQVGIGTMAQGTNSYTVGAAIATVLQANGVNAAPAPGTGETEINALVNDNEVALGIASILEVLNAYNGQGAFEGNPQTDMRVLAALAPLKVALYVRADSDIFSIADLRGRRVTTEFTGLGAIDLILQAVLANGGLTKDDVVPRPVANVAVGADEFEAGNVDAFFFAAGTPRVQQADAAVGGLRMLPLVDTPEAIAAMEAVFPAGELMVQPPTPAHRGFTDPTPLMAYDNILLVNATVPDDVVAQITQIIHDNRDALIAIFAGFNDFDPAAMYKPDLGVPYHPAAEAYYQSLPPATP
ncbi:MAG: TAXI family TRAP transporter solute-binding subunit [Bauldia sp.]